MALFPGPKGLPADPHGNRSYLRGLDRRSGLPPNFQRGLTKKKKRNKDREMKKSRRETLQKGVKAVVSADPLDGVNADLAKVVVNMQQYYASGVDELAAKLGGMEEELRRAKEENERMKERLDMHFGMLGQTAEFMQRISEGLGRAKMMDMMMIGGGEEANQGFDGDGDGDLAMDGGADMEVPPTPVGDGPSMRSTGRMAQRRKGKEKEAGKKGVEEDMGVLPIREKMTMADAPAHDDDVEEKNSRRRRQEDADGSDEDARVLRGAPRLQEVMRQDAMRRRRNDISSLRRCCFTPINRMPPSSRQSTPSSGDDDNNSDSDEYRPPSPSAASYCSSSSFSSSESPPSLSEEEEEEEDMRPPSSSPPPRARLPTPPPTSSSSSSSSSSSKGKRYSERRTTEDRYSCGTPSGLYKFHRMGRTVLDVWAEYKIGTMGNPAIEALEKQYGTEWRSGKKTSDLKYASNYVSVRQKVVKYVEGMCKREGISAEEAIGRLDERVDGRLQMLISAVRKGQDPFLVIPKRRG